MKNAVTKILKRSVGQIIENIFFDWITCESQIKLFRIIVIGLVFFLFYSHQGHTAGLSPSCGTFNSTTYMHGRILIHGHAMGVYANYQEAKAACIADHGGTSGSVLRSVWIPYMYSGEYVA
ncbi:MAG: hypothetical protein PVI90_01360, partial [Desulfobacteraceae bacterium]